MREHEVPTHVQAEDKALLWFTFPQIVAVVATCAVAYGVYRYFPFGPSGLKLGIAILLGVLGIAMTVGKVGGRGLPLVAADLLKFNLGARRYAGCPAELAISEAPPQPEAKPDPLRLLAKKAAGKVGNAVKAARQKGRRPFRPHRWFGKGRPSDRDLVTDHRPTGGESAGRKSPRRGRGWPWRKLLPMAGLLALTFWALPGSALADDPDDNPYGDAWRLGEIYFEPPDPVPGRRVYVERLSVSGDTAAVTLRAAHDLDLKGRVFGGRTGKTLKMGFNTGLAAGQSKSYNLTLDGPSPSFTFSWQDALGFSGAASLKSHQIPYPLPTAEGELCDLEVTPLEWTPGRIAGVISSECIAETRHEEDLPVYGGHFSQSVPALLDATVTGITGTVSVAWGGHSTTATFVRDGDTAFTLPVANNRAVNGLEITADLTATLNVPRPPMLQTVHHPARTDVYTRRVTCACGESRTVKTVRIYVHHKEHVRAVESQRGPVTRTRTESLSLVQASNTAPAVNLGADAPYRALHVPPPKPPPPKAEQTPVGGSSWWSWLWPG
ncbi:MAG: hypothetical protein OXN21_08285, partial [Chloroflexota bacterium]|nr:hypothetical protein [Chloroflexota bacterium]